MPDTATIKELQSQRRLVSRMLKHWDERTSERRFPSKSEINEQVAGADWAHCALISLAPALEQSQFLSVGPKLLDAPGPPLAGEPIGAAPHSSLLHALLVYLPRCIDSVGPLAVSGSAQHGGYDILYRAILLPLSEDGATIDAVLIAANYRDLRPGEDRELRTRRQVVVLSVKKGQIWEVFDALLGAWDKKVVLAIENGQATLRSKSNFQKSLHNVSDMTSRLERYRFIAHG
jgi:hypothetical protein